MTQSILSMAMAWATVKLIVIVVSWFVAGYLLVPLFFRKMMYQASAETLTIVTVALCLGFVCIAAYFHYSVALGAFIAGSVVAESQLLEKIKQLFEPICDIFAAVFFVSIGMLINPLLIWQHLPIILFICVITIIGKLLATGVSALATGQGIKNSLRIGFSMAQIGEFSFIIVSLGLMLGVVGQLLYSIIVAVAAITTFTTPYLIRLANYITKN